MPAELTKEQVEELCADIERRTGELRRSGKLYAKYATLVRALLTLARSAPSAELVKLGEAAVKMWPLYLTYENSTANTSRSADALMALTHAEDAVLEAARTYANSVEKTSA